MKTLLKWLVLAPVLLATGAAALVALDRITDFSILGTRAESRNTQVIESVTRQQQVVLLSLGIQGIDERKDTGTIGGFDVPFSERVAFMQYGFDAKLGIDGADVTIEQSGEDSYVVTIPEFVFLGHDNESFRTVVEEDGAFSWTTPEIDTAETITEILNDEARSEYIASNEDTLRSQAEVFYRGIITGIDPELDVEFEFSS